MPNETLKPFDDIALELARNAVPELETLETRKWDTYDFHEVSVWGLKKALFAAYSAGIKAGAATKGK